MNVNAFAVSTLEQAREHTVAAVEGLTGEEMLFQPKAGMNHALWLLGHIAESENGLLLGFCKGANLLPVGWHEKFGIGSKPVADRAKYPSREEVLKLMEKVHAAAIEYVRSLSPEDLDRRPAGIDRLPERAQALFATIGKCIYQHALHESSHAGQIATLRRFLGRPPRV